MHSTIQVTPLLGSLFLGVALYQTFICAVAITGNLGVGRCVLQYLKQNTVIPTITTW